MVRTRDITCKIQEAIEEGLLDPASVLRECLAYMSEADVADMAGDWFTEPEPETEDEEDS